MSATLSFNGRISSENPLSAIRPPGAISQSNANPLAAELETPEKSIQAALANRHRWDMLAEQAAITPDAFFAAHPFTPIPGEDPAARKMRLTNRVFLRSRLDGRAIPGGDLGYEVTRARIAKALFGGRGADDDAVFHGEVLKHVQTAKDKREVEGMVADEAAAAALTGALDPTARTGAWKATREKLKLMPGYDPANESDHVTAFRAVEAETRARMAPYAQELATVWEAMKQDTVGQAVLEVFGRTTPADREGLKNALGLLARSMPKEQQATFFGSLAKQISRDAVNIPQAAAAGLTTEVQKGGTWGWQDFFGSEEAVRARNLKDATTAKEYRQKIDFLTDVRDIAEGVYDPVKAPHDGLLGSIERGIFAAPGAIASMVVGFVPVVGNLAFYGMAREDSYQTIRKQLRASGFKGDAEAVADDLAGIASIPYALADKMGAEMIAARMPWFNKLVSGVADRVVKTALARGAVRTVAGGTIETATEMGQGYLPLLVLDMATGLQAQIPDVRWRGSGGVFDGAWTESLETFVAMLPLAMFGAAHGHFADKQLARLQAATDTELTALGYSAPAIEKIRASAGSAALRAEVMAANATRDPNSPQAAAAVAELEAQLKAQLKAAESLKASGVLPDVVVSKDGFQVRDPETREIIGTAADAAGALKIAAAHSAAMDDAAADEVAYWATTLEAAQAAVTLDPNSRQSVELSRVMTEAAIAAENPAALDDFHAQQRLRELAGGGDGSVTDAALGLSQTAFRETVRETTNRIFRGGSVLTAFHETAHGLRRGAHAAGVLTRADDLAIIRAVDAVMDGKRMRHGADGGRSLRLIPEGVADEDVTDKMIDEGISEILEMEVMRTRAGGKKRPEGHGIPSSVNRVAPGIISRNLSALARLAGDSTVGKWKAFSDAVRGLFGLATQRALALRKAERDGLFDTEMYDAYLDRLTNTTAQRAHENAAAGVAGEILAGETPFSLAPDALSKLLAARGSDRIKVIEINDMVPTLRRIDARKMLSSGPSSILGPHRNEESEMIFEITPATLDKTIIQPTKEGEPDGSHRVRIAASFSLPEIIKSAVAVPVDDAMPERKAAGVVDLYAAIRWHGVLYRVRVKGIISHRGNNHARSMKVEDVLIENAPSAGKTNGAGLSADAAKVAPREAITLNELFNAVNNPKSGPSFSLAPSAMVARLNERAISLMRNPRERAAAYNRLSRKLADLRLTFERLELMAGVKRRKASLRKEAAVRQALREDELTNEVWARHGAILSEEDLTRLKAQPVHALLADPNSKMRGRLMSKGRALQQQADLFITAKGGEWDGADGISRAVFGGSLLPDQAAQELYANHLISEPTPDAMWDAIRREQAFVDKMKEALRKAADELREAKQQAKRETNDWLASQSDTQAAAYSDKQEILRALAVLDGVLAVVPAEIRGKVGGYTQLAALGSNETRLEFLKRRLAMVDQEMEKWLSAQYDREFRDLLKRTRPAKEKPGEKPTGTIGADLHEVFRAVEASMKWKPAEVEAEATKLESLAASGTLTAEEEANAITQANLIRLAGNWTPIYRAVLDANGDPTGETVMEYPGADAARREQAVIEAARIIESGYWNNRMEAAKKRADRAAIRDRLKVATGKAGTQPERVNKALEDHGLKGGKGWRPALANLYSFEQLLNVCFGEKAEDSRRIADAERWASDKKSDAVFRATNALENLYTELAGGGLAGAELAWKLAQKSMTVQGLQLSEMEAVHWTMMWRQEDGQRHMLGHQDENGNYVGAWHYDQAFVDELEANLSPEAKQVRLFLSEHYAGEYDRLNPVYRSLNGVNLPRVKMYSPLTVVPQQVKAGQEVDPVTGFAQTGGFTPGSLKNRSQDAIAEPRLMDATQAFIAHVKQIEHWIAYAPLTQEMMQVLGNRDLRASIEAKAGKESVNMLSQWMEYFSVGGNRDASAQLGLSQKFGTLTWRAASVALVGRLGVLWIQSTQIFAAIAEMPTGAYLSRLAKLQFGQLGWADALKSDYIQRRLQQLPPAVRIAVDGLNASKPSRLKHNMAKVGRLIGGFDALFTAGTYAICLDYHRAQARKDGMDAAAAEIYAHQAAQRSCDRVAQPTRAGARSIFENLSTNPMMRVSWAFASEARQKLGLFMYTMANPEASAAQKARVAALVWLVGGLGATMLRSVYRDMRDDDDEEWFDEKNWGVKRLALSTLTGPLGGVPLLGDILEAGVYKAVGEYLPEGNLFSSTGQAARAVRHVPDWFTGEREMGDAIKDVEAILSGMGLFHDGIAAAASLSHLVRDVFGMVKNAVD